MQTKSWSVIPNCIASKAKLAGDVEVIERTNSIEIKNGSIGIRIPTKKNTGPNTLAPIQGIQLHNGQ